jgi:hypothetical protein
MNTYYGDTSNADDSGMLLYVYWKLTMTELNSKPFRHLFRNNVHFILNQSKKSNKSVYSQKSNEKIAQAPFFITIKTFALKVSTKT